MENTIGPRRVPGLYKVSVLLAAEQYLFSASAE